MRALEEEFGADVRIEVYADPAPDDNFEVVLEGHVSQALPRAATRTERCCQLADADGVVAASADPLQGDDGTRNLLYRGGGPADHRRYAAGGRQQVTNVER